MIPIPTAIALLHDKTNERRRVKRKPVPAPGAICVSKSPPTCTVSFESASALPSHGPRKAERNSSTYPPRPPSPTPPTSTTPRTYPPRSSISFPTVELSIPVACSSSHTVVSPSLSSPVSFPSSSTSPPQTQPHALLRPRQRIAASFSSLSPDELKSTQIRRKRAGSTTSAPAATRKKARKSSSSSSSSSSGKENPHDCSSLSLARKTPVGELRLQVNTYKCLVGCITRQRCRSERDADGDVPMEDSGASSMVADDSSVRPLSEDGIENDILALPLRSDKEQLEMQDRLLTARLRSFLVWYGVDVDSVERDVARGIAASLPSTMEVENGKSEKGETENVEASSSVPVPSSSSSPSSPSLLMDMDTDFPESDLRSCPDVVSFPSSSPTSTEDLTQSTEPAPSSPCKPLLVQRPPSPAHIAAALLVRHAGRARRRGPERTSSAGESRVASPLRQSWV